MNYPLERHLKGENYLRKKTWLEEWCERKKTWSLDVEENLKFGKVSEFGWKRKLYEGLPLAKLLSMILFIVFQAPIDVEEWWEMI